MATVVSRSIVTSASSGSGISPASRYSLDALLHRIVIGAGQDRDARALAGGVRQDLPRLVGASEFKNPYGDEEQQRQRQRHFKQGLAPLTGRPRASCLGHHVPHPPTTATQAPTAIAGAYANRLSACPARCRWTRRSCSFITRMARNMVCMA